MIEATYTLTFDDYREANGIPVKETAQARWARWKLLVWVLVIGAVGVVFAFLNARVARQMAGFPGREPIPFGRLLLTMSPALGLCLLFTFFLFRTARNPTQKPWVVPPPASGRDKNRPGPNTVRRSLMGWILFVAFAVLFFVLKQSGGTATIPGVQPPTRLPLAFDFLLSFIPIFFLLAVIGAYAGWSSRRTAPRTWEQMKHEHEPRTLRADAEGMVIEQATATMRYGWTHFAGYKETKTLLLVYLSPYQFHMIPKRAFATPADVDAFKGLLMNGVEEGSFLPNEGSGFAVVPMAQVVSTIPEGKLR